jgi:hypothetical protein
MQVLSRLAKNWFSTLFVVCAVFGFFYFRHLNDGLATRAKFMIGQLGNSHYIPKSGRSFNYQFAVNNKLYGGSSLVRPGMDERPVARYLVKFDSTDPTVSAAYFIAPIPNSIRQAPLGGWNHPPIPVPEWVDKTMHKSEK